MILKCSLRSLKPSLNYNMFSLLANNSYNIYSTIAQSKYKKCVNIICYNKYYYKKILTQWYP